MAIPTRTAASIANVPKIPVFAVNDPTDTNPFFFTTDNGLTLGINYNALMDANGLINLSNAMATGAVTATQLAAGSVTEAKVTAPTNNVLNALRVGKWTYDFSVLGGLVSTIPLTGPTLPNHAVVIGGVMDVTTIVAGAGGTGAIQVEGANDIISAAAFSGAPWSSTGLKPIVPIFTNATYKKTTAARVPSIVITTSAITAGVFNLQLIYMVDDA